MMDAINPGMNTEVPGKTSHVLVAQTWSWVQNPSQEGFIYLDATEVSEKII